MKDTSRTACISATVTRSILKRMDLESALKLSLPRYSINSDLLSQLEYRTLLKASSQELRRVEESRWRGTCNQRQVRG